MHPSPPPFPNPLIQIPGSSTRRPRMSPKIRNPPPGPPLKVLSFHPCFLFLARFLCLMRVRVVFFFFPRGCLSHQGVFIYVKRFFWSSDVFRGVFFLFEEIAQIVFFSWTRGGDESLPPPPPPPKFPLEHGVSACREGAFFCPGTGPPFFLLFLHSKAMWKPFNFCSIFFVSSL